MGCLKMDEPEIVKILKEEEIGRLQEKTYCKYENLQMIEKSDDATDNTICFVENDAKKLEDAIELENIEKTYKTIFENYAIAVTFADNNEQIISWNKYTEELLNMNEKELFKAPVSSLYPSEEWKRIRAENVRKKGIKYRMETKMIRKDKGPFDVEISLCILRGFGGQTVGSVGIIKDITKLKQTERKLKESEKRYKTIFENSAVAITLADEHERIISWNKYAEKLLDMDKNELSLKPVESLYPPKEWKKIRKENVRQKGMQHHLETKILKKNNELLDVDISLSILKDNEGEITGSIGVIRDISERKEAEQRLDSIMKYAGDTIYLLDRDYRYLLVNNELVSRLNLSKDHLLGKTISELHTPAEAREFTDKIDQVFENGKTIKYEHKKNDKWFLRTLSPIKDYMTGQITAVLVISKDITGIKKTEEDMRIKDSAIASSINAIIIADLDGNLTYVNRSFLKMWRYDKPEEALGKNTVQLWQMKGKSVEILDILSDKDGWIGELTGIRKDESTFHVQLSANMIKDEFEKPICIMASFVDITEHKQAINALSESEEKFRVVLENSPDMIYQLNIKANTYDYVSPSSIKLLGYIPEEIISFGVKKMNDLIHPDDKKILKNHFKKLVSREDGKEIIQALEYRIKHKKFGYRWVSDIRSVIFDEKDEAVVIVGNAKDITEQRKVWNEMVKSEEKYRVLAETSADGVFTTDVLGRLTYINPSLEKMMGQRKSKILATPFKNYLPESSVYLFQQIIVEIRKNDQKMENIELEITHDEGYDIPVEANIAPLKKEGVFVGIECTLRDVSEREKVLRELKKSENLRTEFMNIAAHELKSPVTPIKGYLELIESDKDVDEKIRKWARIALRNAERLLLLVNDILDVSRLDTDTMRFNMKKIDSVKILDDAAEDIKPAIENKNLKFIKEVPKDLPEIFADKYRLSQVLKNLLGNAVKFTDYGSVSLKASIEENQLLISVEDTGVGVSSDELKKIFTKLYQAYTGEDRKNEGAGLGLYICKEIIRKHKGKIWAKSEISKGSSFFIKLPI
jgi:PAS domain S-box-containing protein